jgi:hypothetical protein
MPGFVDDFVKATKDMPSPEIFRRWSGIAAVSAAMSKRVWTCILGDLPLYGNLFVFLVSNPGLGKSLPIRAVQRMLKKLKARDGKALVWWSPNQITHEGLLTRMADTFKKDVPDGMRTYFGLISEFGTFMPEPNTVLLQTLADIWDCPEFYEKGTKTSGDDLIYNPYFCLFAGVQPAWFERGFPKNTYELGLPSRTFFVYETLKPDFRFFTEIPMIDGEEDLVGALRAISRVSGLVKWAPAAKARFEGWVEAGMEPMPDDPLLMGYCTRRAAHLGKLSMIAAVQRDQKEPVIEVKDVETAMGWMFEAEVRMPEALSAAGGNIYRLKEETVMGFVRAEYIRTKKHVHEKVIRKRLGQMVSTTMISPILDELIRQQRLRVLATSVEPNRLLKPGDA